MPRFGGCVPPVVVASVAVVHRRIDQLGGVDIVQTCQAHRHVGAADLLDVSAPEWAYAAVAAEQMMRAIRTEAVIAECILTCEQAERIGFGDRRPVAGLGADRAIAFARALRQVDIGLELHRATMTAALIRFFHQHFSAGIDKSCASQDHNAPLPDVAEYSIAERY